MPDIQLLAREHNTAAIAKPQPWAIQTSPAAAPGSNIIRTTLAAVTSKPPATSATPINLGLGDPTLYGLHPPPPAAETALIEAVQQGKNSYLFGTGELGARQAVCDYHERWDGVHYSPDDVVLTHGVAHALDLVLSVLVPPGPSHSVLVPRPGFGLYASLLASLGSDIRYYGCVEERGWEVDVADLEAQIDSSTRCIILTNPSNPCGSNFTAAHLRAVLAVAERHRVVVIADEIYGHMTFNAPFVPLASLSTNVPVVTLSGLSKRFLLPGRRFGWCCLHDPLGVAGNVRQGMHAWANRIFGPSSIDQAALPAILATPDAWFSAVVDKVAVNADITYDAVNDTPGLSCSRPEGALYVFVKIDMDAYPEFADGAAFCQALYQEEALFVMPGVAFGAPSYFRIVIAVPADTMREVGARLRQFGERHYRG